MQYKKDMVHYDDLGTFEVESLELLNAVTGANPVNVACPAGTNDSCVNADCPSGTANGTCVDPVPNYVCGGSGGGGDPTINRSCPIAPIDYACGHPTGGNHPCSSNTGCHIP